MAKSSGTISLPLAVIIGLNAVIGAGIFGIPAALQVTAGPAGLVTFLAVIIAVLFIALGLGRMTTLYPMESFFYQYPKLWLGHAGGLLTTTLYVLGLVTALGLLSFLAGSYTAANLPFFSPIGWAVAFLITLVLLNLLGARANTAGQIVLLIFTILPLVIITSMCATKIDVSHATPFAPHGLWGAFEAIKVVAFSLFGFEAIPSLFSTLKNPRKTAPIALALTVIITGLCYLTFTGSILLAAPQNFFTSATEPLSKLMLTLFPQFSWLVKLIDGAIVITILGTVHSLLWSVSALVADTAHSIRGRKTISRHVILLFVGIGAICCSLFFANINLLLSIISVAIAGAYATSLVPLITLPYQRSFWQIILAFLGIGCSLVLCTCGILGIIAAW